MGLIMASLEAASTSLHVLIAGGGQDPAEPPATSGNLTTVILGLTASSLLLVVVGSWLVEVVRGVRKGLRTWRRDPTARPTEDHRRAD